MRTLYEIVDALAALEEELAAAGGDLTPAAEEALEQLPGELAEKCERILEFILEEQALAASRKEEAQRLVTLARANENRAAALEKWVVENLRRLPERNVRTRLGTLRPQRNGTPTLVPIVPVDALDERFRRVSVEPNGAEAIEFWRDVMRREIGDAKGRELQERRPKAVEAATQALNAVGFDARLGWHLRRFS